jgi:hypothetical protein
MPLPGLNGILLFSLRQHDEASIARIDKTCKCILVGQL